MNRDITVRLKVTKEESKAWRAAAAAEGCTLSEWIRRRSQGIGKRAQTGAVKTRLGTADKKWLAEQLRGKTISRVVKVPSRYWEPHQLIDMTIAKLAIPPATETERACIQQLKRVRARLMTHPG